MSLPSSLRRTEEEIAAIRAFRVELPLSEGLHVRADGRSAEVFEATLVAVESGAGPFGRGE